MFPFRGVFMSHQKKVNVRQTSWSLRKVTQDTAILTLRIPQMIFHTKSARSFYSHFLFVCNSIEISHKIPLLRLFLTTAKRSSIISVKHLRNFLTKPLSAPKSDLAFAHSVAQTQSKDLPVTWALFCSFCCHNHNGVSFIFAQSSLAVSRDLFGGSHAHSPQ